MSDSNQLEVDLEAVTTVVSALAPLEPSHRARVMNAVATLLGEPSSIVSTPTSINSLVDAAKTTAADAALVDRARITDVRSLRDEKRPRSANEMAAVVAYYLAELAPEPDRTTAVSSSDMEKYFKQAGHPLPKVIGQLLPNATAAGYFDQAGRGQYKLNPVGYNLVAHSLPAANQASSRGQVGVRRSTRARPRGAAKKAAPTKSVKPSRKRRR